MKKHLVLLVGVALTLGACSDDDTQSGKVLKQSVNFNISSTNKIGDGAVTRTVTDNGFNTSFVAGDGIGIYAAKGADGINVIHEVQADGSLSPSKGEGVFYNGYGDKTADFYAYYPYGVQESNSAVTISVAKNQSSEKAFNACDFLTATSLDVPVNTSEINLKFQHQMSLVQLQVVLARDVNMPDSVLLHNCRSSLSWKYKSGEYTTMGDSIDIRMWDRIDQKDTLTYWALIPPQTVNAKSELLSLYDGNKTFIFTTTGAIEFAKNKVKKFKIGIGADGSIVLFNTELEVKAWEDDGSEINGGGTLLRPSILLDTQNFTTFNWTDISKSKEEALNAPGWYRYAPDAKDTINVVEDKELPVQGKAIHLYRDTITGWHNGTWFYSVKDVVKARYELKFKAKSSMSDNMKANQLRIGAFMKGEGIDYFGVIEGSSDGSRTTLYEQITKYDQYDEHTIIFDLRKVSSTHAASKLTDEQLITPSYKMMKNVVLYLSPNAQRTHFYIDDISWRPLDD